MTGLPWDALQLRARRSEGSNLRRHEGRMCTASPAPSLRRLDKEHTKD
jgi:hypothetical protein